MSDVSTESSAAVNPYAPPAAPVDPYAQPGVRASEAPPLWNPDAAGVWSLLLSPVFGSVLIWLNWRRLGEDAKAERGLTVVLASMVMLILTPFVRGIGLFWIVIWYFAWQRKQTRYVSERFGKDYPRRPWTQVVCAAVLLYFAIGLMAGLFFLPVPV
ncbi:MAG: hypothetical protein AAFX50_22815 [Acidobacteriota bacterium]